MSSPFVKAECGCIALSVPIEDEHVVVRFCDADDEFGMNTRGLRGDTFTPLTKDESLALIKEVGGMCAAGYLLEELSRYLRMLVK